MLLEKYMEEKTRIEEVVTNAQGQIEEVEYEIEQA